MFIELLYTNGKTKNIILNELQKRFLQLITIEFPAVDDYLWYTSGRTFISLLTVYMILNGVYS